MPSPSTDEARARAHGLSTALQYASANTLLVLGAGALVVGGWAPFVVIGLIMVFKSFADELSGDDWDSLADRARAFFNLNLYLSLPLICLL